MAEQPIPNAQGPVLDGRGRLTREWFNFHAGLARRVAPNVADLPASPTVEQIATAFNTLLAALQSAGLQRDT